MKKLILMTLLIGLTSSCGFEAGKCYRGFDSQYIHMPYNNNLDYVFWGSFDVEIYGPLRTTYHTHMSFREEVKCPDSLEAHNFQVKDLKKIGAYDEITKHINIDIVD